MRWVEISQATEVEIKGNAGALPYVTCVVTDEMPYFLMSKEDEKNNELARLKIHYDIKNNDVVEVDFDKHKVIINGELMQETIDFKYADFFHFESGINYIRTVPSMQIEVEYTEKWK